MSTVPMTVGARARLALNLAVREMRNRFAGSHLGILWAFFVPLISSAIFVVIFGILMSGMMSGIYARVDFTTMYFMGFAPWLLFSDVAARATGIIRDNRALIRNLQFDHRLLPVSICASSTVAHLVVLLVACALIVLKGHSFSAHLWALPIYYALLLVFTLGAGYLLAALSVYLPDLAHAVPIALNLLFFMAPILYPPALVENNAGPTARFLLLEVNPITRFVEGYRRALIEVGQPFDWENLAWCTGWALLAIVLGLAAYRKLEKGFADVL